MWCLSHVKFGSERIKKGVLVLSCRDGSDHIGPGECHLPVVVAIRKYIYHGCWEIGFYSGGHGSFVTKSFNVSATTRRDTWLRATSTRSRSSSTSSRPHSAVRPPTSLPSSAAAALPQSRSPRVQMPRPSRSASAPRPRQPLKPNVLSTTRRSDEEFPSKQGDKGTEASQHPSPFHSFLSSDDSFVSDTARVVSTKSQSTTASAPPSSNHAATAGFSPSFSHQLQQMVDKFLNPENNLQPASRSNLPSISPQEPSPSGVSSVNRHTRQASTRKTDVQQPKQREFVLSPPSKNATALLERLESLGKKMEAIRQRSQRFGRKPSTQLKPAGANQSKHQDTVPTHSSSPSQPKPPIRSPSQGSPPPSMFQNTMVSPVPQPTGGASPFLTPHTEDQHRTELEEVVSPRRIDFSSTPASPFTPRSPASPASETLRAWLSARKGDFATEAAPGLPTSPTRALHRVPSNSSQLSTRLARSLDLLRFKKRVSEVATEASRGRTLGANP